MKLRTVAGNTGWGIVGAGVGDVPGAGAGAGAGVGDVPGAGAGAGAGAGDVPGVGAGFGEQPANSDRISRAATAQNMILVHNFFFINIALNPLLWLNASVYPMVTWWI